MESPEHDSIHLMREADVPAVTAGARFGYSRATVVGVVAVVLGLGAGLITVGYRQGNPFTYYLAALPFVFLWIYQTMVLARFRESNWLVQIADRGAYIKFRSYLNHHFPVEDRTVVYIPFRDMRLTRVVRELQEVPDTDGRGTSTRRSTVVEIELKVDTFELAQALSDERRAKAPTRSRWYGSSAGRYQHHPVRLATPRTIALEWEVFPRASVFLGIMAMHTPVEATEVVRDYSALGALKMHEQESKLVELTERGQFLDAVRLARSLYGYDLTQAKQFVDSLAGRAKA